MSHKTKNIIPLVWKPIKTAPKDKIILLAEPPFSSEYNWVVLAGRWIDVPSVNQMMEYWGKKVNTKPAEEGHWQAIYDGIMSDGKNEFTEPRWIFRMKPTHWLPLPEPPRGNFKRTIQK